MDNIVQFSKVNHSFCKDVWLYLFYKWKKRELGDMSQSKLTTDSNCPDSRTCWHLCRSISAIWYKSLFACNYLKFVQTRTGSAYMSRISNQVSWPKEANAEGTNKVAFPNVLLTITKKWTHNCFCMPQEITLHISGLIGISCSCNFK